MGTGTEGLTPSCLLCKITDLPFGSAEPLYDYPGGVSSVCRTWGLAPEVLRLLCQLSYTPGAFKSPWWGSGTRTHDLPF